MKSRSRLSSRRPDSEIAQAMMEDDDRAWIVVDPEGKVALANPAAARLLALPASRLRRADANELLRTMVPGEEPVREAFRRSATERELVLHTRNGEVPALLRTRRVGRPPWLAIAVRDLSQTRRMQQELRRNERLATLGQLAMGVAHEIRNPLASIDTSAQVLLGRFEPRDERVRFVHVIREEVGRLDRIATRLMEYVRPRSPELRPALLSSCIERVVQLAADAIEKARVEVEVDVPRRLGPVYIDPDLVVQVLLNVTLNALHAMPDGGRLRYEASLVRRRGPARGAGRRAVDRRTPRAAATPWIAYQQVRILDTGAGIPRGNLSKLFDPFFTTKRGGTGLGLSICQTIMQEHGGAIAVASREARGTTVLLNFPVEKRHGPRRTVDGSADLAQPAHR